jgi:hypothetical protein
MDNFTAHCLRFVCDVCSPLELTEHPGSALRGALFGALRAQFCANLAAPACASCPHHTQCPVCLLVATVDDQAARGQEPPRPYVIVPPLAKSAGIYSPGDTLEFGLTLFAGALNLFPYVILAVQRMGSEGLGIPQPGQGGRLCRGAFTLRQVLALNPLTGESRAIPAIAALNAPGLPVTHAHVLAAAGALSAAGGATRLTLEFLTPTRLVVAGRPIPRPSFGVLIQRLLERLDALDSRFAGGGLDPAESFRLVGLAGAVPLAAETTRWAHAESHSSRQQRSNTISGFMGQAVYSGDMAAFLPYLVWGSITHVGKDAVKGDGNYRIV